MSRFQGDIKISITEDGAKMKFVDGEPVRDQGLENAVSISLFTKKNWWGNSLIRDINKKIGSNFERQRTIIYVSTLNEIRDDANKALKWMTDTNLASKIDLTIENPNLNYITISIIFPYSSQDIKELLFFSNGINWINQAANPANERMRELNVI